MRKVEVSPYNEHWVAMYEEEASGLREVFGNLLVAIHHIGSTSVPGLAAKTIIDIMPVVKDIALVDGYNGAMRELGYEPKGENGILGRRYFQKGGDNRTHHVHIYGGGSPNIERHIAFRDYLRNNEIEAKAYGQLKLHLAQQFPYEIDSYIKGKEQLASEIEHRAMEWYRSRQQ